MRHHHHRRRRQRNALVAPPQHQAQHPASHITQVVGARREQRVRQRRNRGGAFVDGGLPGFAKVMAGGHFPFHRLHQFRVFQQLAMGFEDSGLRP